MTELGEMVQTEACNRLYNHEKKGRGKAKRKTKDDDDGADEEGDVQVPVVVHA